MHLSKLSIVLLTYLGIGLAPSLQASSHREAPFITEIPKADGADFYLFTSYEAGRSDYVTLIANYLPLQAGYGGPNYFTLDPQALYEIHIDNTGDAREDLTFQFRFNVQQQNQTLNIGGKTVATPLINFGPATTGLTAGLNVQESYEITLVRGDRRSGTRSSITNAVDNTNRFTKPVDNIGAKSIANYDAYANAFIYNINIPGCSQTGKVFVGQRKDPFQINLGEIFDLINLNPLSQPDAETNVLNDANVTALVLEIHKSCLTSGSEPVIGAWTTASLRQARLLRPEPSFDSPALEGGAWTQVSRLGMPLVNEVVIGLLDKDKFNASKPQNDSQFADYVTNPTFPALVETLFPVVAPTNFPRNDLVATFLTGIQGINKPASVTPSEMLRLNTATAPTEQSIQNSLGVLGGDSAGYPNGRRLGDDVVDITLRVSMGVLCTLSIGCVPTDAPAGSAPFTDGAAISAANFGTTFPYLNTPLAGSPSN